ncbi:protein kinase [Nannocystis sp. SCPEA4]|uniref:serine/threonine protein kinase n=1 Tax=Nannocystis sp. SCPEA4 TaxID=2996787 RepID=UPI00226F4585|nr:protein kinase [Nannocystis sp. SCPEA4]
MVELFPPPLGARIAGRFELLAPLRGQGAVRTFLVRDLQTKQRRALSLFDPARVQAGVWQEFARIIAAAAVAKVPGLLRPAEVPAEPPDPPHIVHDLSPHRDLDRVRAQDGRIAWQRALTIGERIAAVLHGALVATGVAHRALTPSHCLVDARDEVELLDFGVAEFEPGGESHDEADYRAPEQRRGQGDPRSDVYSLAVILFESICGERPADDASPSSSVDVPPAVDRLFSQALAPEPDRRFADAGALRAALREVLGLPALPTSAPQAAVQPPSAPPLSQAPNRAPRTAPARSQPDLPPLETVVESTERLPPIASAQPPAPALPEVGDASTERLPARAPRESSPQLVPAKDRASEVDETTSKWGKRVGLAPRPPETTEVLTPTSGAAQPRERTEVLPQPRPAERIEVLREPPREREARAVAPSESFEDRQTIAMPVRKRDEEPREQVVRPSIEPTVIVSSAHGAAAAKGRERLEAPPTLELSPARDAKPALSTTLLVVNAGLALAILLGLLWAFS